MCARRAGTVFEAEIIEQRAGFVAAVFKGAGAKRLFAREAGGHRWQRVPPTERRGRVQTSTVTVAVLEPRDFAPKDLAAVDIVVRTQRGSGKGGQHRNKTDSCVTAVHRPTGLSVRVDLRSQHRSRTLALEILAAKVSAAKAEREADRSAKHRREQVGSGMRGDKIRTYRVKDDRVVDHRTNQSWTFAAWKRGEWGEPAAGI